MIARTPHKVKEAFDNAKKKRLQVVLGNSRQRVGELLYVSEPQRDYSIFTYASEWLEAPDCFELEPALPLSPGPFYFVGDREDPRASMPPCVSDSLPDSWGRDVISRYLGFPPSELDCLVNTNDTTRIGALRFVDDDGQALAHWPPSVHPIPRLDTLSNLEGLHRAFEKRSQGEITSARGDPHYEDVSRQLLGISAGLGGDRPKSDYDDQGTLAIAKYTSLHDKASVVRAEVATLNLARLCGLYTADARLELKGSSYPVAIIRRFDRQGNKRLHYLSAQSMLQARHRSLHFYTDLVEQMRVYGANPIGQFHELFRRALFDCLIKNKDNHLRNHGFLFTGFNNKWNLSPAFDINPNPTKGHGLQTGISELSGAEGSITGAIEAAPFFEMTEDDAVKLVGNMARTITNCWQTLFRQHGMATDDIKHFVPAFDHREMRLALALPTSHLPVPGPDDPDNHLPDESSNKTAADPERRPPRPGM